MKYAKKMKLVEIDDIPQSTSHNHVLLSDEQFTAPRTLSMLDNYMKIILERTDISDGEKWQLYSQTLQKYLNHMKRSEVPNLNGQQFDSSISRDHTPYTFNNRLSDHDISGIFPMKPSIENISQPTVRAFFEQAKISDANSVFTRRMSDPIHSHQNDSDIITPTTPTQFSSPEAMSIGRPSITSSMETTRNVAMRRRKKRGHEHNMTAIHPYKVAPREVVIAAPPNLSPKQLYRNRNPALYWEASNAK